MNINSHPLVITVEDDENDLSPKASWKWDLSGRVNYYVYATGAEKGSIQHVHAKTTIPEVRLAALVTVLNLREPLNCLSIKRT